MKHDCLKSFLISEISIFESLEVSPEGDYILHREYEGGYEKGGYDKVRRLTLKEAHQWFRKYKKDEPEITWKEILQQTREFLKAKRGGKS